MPRWGPWGRKGWVWWDAVPKGGDGGSKSDWNHIQSTGLQSRRQAVGSHRFGHRRDGQPSPIVRTAPVGTGWLTSPSGHGRGSPPGPPALPHCSPGQKIVMPLEKPIKATGHLQILFGNLAPEVCRRCQTCTHTWSETQFWCRVHGSQIVILHSNLHQQRSFSPWSPKKSILRTCMRVRMWVLPTPEPSLKASPASTQTPIPISGFCGQDHWQGGSALQRPCLGVRL